MSWSVCATSVQIAMKDYYCDTCDNWLNSGLTPSELNMSLSDAKEEFYR